MYYVDFLDLVLFDSGRDKIGGIWSVVVFLGFLGNGVFV